MLEETHGQDDEGVRCTAAVTYSGENPSRLPWYTADMNGHLLQLASTR